MHLNSLGFAVGAVVLGGAIAPAHASDVADAAADAPVITVTGVPSDSDDAAVAVTRVSAEELARQQVVVVTDALARLPGVDVSRNGPVGGLTSVRLRGADASHTLVLIDDMRTADPAAPGGGFDFGNLLLTAPASIEVLRGPASVVWGSDAIGGVVRVARADPADGLHATLLGEGGARDTRRYGGTISAAEDGLSLSLTGQHYRTDGVSAAARGSERDGFRQTALSGQLRGDVAPGLEVMATLSHRRGRLGLDGYAPPTYAFGDTPEEQRTQEWTGGGQVRHNWTFASGWELNQTAQVSRATTRRRTFGNASQQGAAPNFDALGRLDRVGYRLAVARDDVAEIVAGVDRESSRMRTRGTFSRDAGRTHTTGIYALGSVTPLPALTLSAGVRREDHARFGKATVVSAQGLWRVTDALRARASYAEGFKAPTLFQLSADRSAYGNPALRPERAKGFDGALIWGGDDDRFSAEIGAFRRVSRDLIDFVGCGAGGPAICAGGTRPFGTYDNVARAVVWGGEARATARQVIAGVDLNAAYTFLRTRDRSAGAFSFDKRLPRRPAHRVTLSADWSPVERVTLGADWLHVGRSFDDRGNAVRLSPQDSVTLRASFDLDDRLTLFGRVENLTNDRDPSVAGYGREGRGLFAGVRARL